MAKTKHDFHVLNKRELLHLMDAGIHDLAGFERTAKAHKTDRDRNRELGHRGIEPCWECRAIAVKLGVPI